VNGYGNVVHRERQRCPRWWLAAFGLGPGRSDAHQQDCGVRAGGAPEIHGAVCFVEMDQHDGLDDKGSTSGVEYDTGYCDALYPHGIKFIRGEASAIGWLLRHVLCKSRKTERGGWSSTYVRTLC